MSLLIWLSLAFCLASIAIASFVLVRRGLGAWRAFRSFTEATASGLDHVMTTAAAAEAHIGAAGDGTVRLEAASTRLQRSLAELAVLRAAAGEARSFVAGVRGVVPRK